MTPDWNNLNLHPTIVVELRTRYEDIEATLHQKVAAGLDDEAERLRQVLARIEQQAITGAVGDQPEELTAEDESILDEVWARPIK